MNITNILTFNAPDMSSQLVSDITPGGCEKSSHPSGCFIDHDNSVVVALPGRNVHINDVGMDGPPRYVVTYWGRVAFGADLTESSKLVASGASGRSSWTDVAHLTVPLELSQASLTPARCRFNDDESVVSHGHAA